MMKTNQVIKELKIGRKALLVYEERGLIHPSRNLSNYRVYSNSNNNLRKLLF